MKIIGECQQVSRWVWELGTKAQRCRMVKLVERKKINRMEAGIVTDLPTLQ